MTTVTFDTLELVNELISKGFTQDQAQVVISVIKQAQSELATKRDLIDLKKDLIIWLGGLMALSIGVVAVLVKLL
jgi:hypothetical protein